MTPVVARDRYYIPLHAVIPSEVRKRLEIPIETKDACRPQCPIANKRGQYCSTCPSREAKVILWERITTAKGRNLLAVPAGDSGVLQHIIRGPYEIIDRRSAPKMKSPLKWTGKLRDGSLDHKGRPTSNQKQMVQDWYKHTNTETGGLVISPPRSGKTVVGVAAAMLTRLRTFITASKIDFLRQFGKRFGELTNLKQVYKAGWRPVVLLDPKGWIDGPQYGVHVIKKWGPDVDKADVFMCCYHQLLDNENGRARLKQYMNGKFGLAEGDEIHLAGAPCFSRVMGRINVRRRLGLTATPNRKDGLLPVVKAILGRIATIGRVASDLPRIELLETGIGSTQNYSNWAAMTKYLVTSNERNSIILRNVMRDLRSNRKHCILIPTTRRQHILDLVKMINAQAEFCRRNHGEDWPNELAVAYYGKSDTNAILNQVNSGRARVVVAMVSMTQYGLDVMRWTHAYLGIVPTSNPYNVFQLLNRVCTPYSTELKNKIGEKPQAIVRYFVDQMSASVFCFKRLYDDKEYGIQVGITGRNFYGVKLCFGDTTTLQRMEAIAKYPKSYSAEDVGVKIELGKTRTGKRRRKSAWTASKGLKRF